MQVADVERILMYPEGHVERRIEERILMHIEMRMEVRFGQAEVRSLAYLAMVGLREHKAVVDNLALGARVAPQKAPGIAYQRFVLPARGHIPIACLCYAHRGASR